jgi:hypothetical protein
MLLDVGVPCADVCVNVRLYQSIKTDTGRTVERTVIGHVVYEQNPHSAAVVCGGNSAEALLTSGVPLR